MIRLFNAYFPTRTLLLTVTEALLVTLGFVVAVVFWAGTAFDANIYLRYENGFGRIGLVVGVFLLLMYYFDLYDSVVLSNRREVVTRLVGVLGCSFVSLSVLYYAFPEIRLAGTTLWLGVAIVGTTVPAWRKLFFVMNRSARFSERAILYGDGPLALPLDGGDQHAAPILGCAWSDSLGPTPISRAASRASRRSISRTLLPSRESAASWSPWATAAARCRSRSCCA